MQTQCKDSECVNTRGSTQVICICMFGDQEEIMEDVDKYSLASRLLLQRGLTASQC